MKLGGRPEFGVCAAVDVHHLKTGGARAAAVLAAGAVFSHVLAERTALVPWVPRPGQRRRRRSFGCGEPQREHRVRHGGKLPR